MPIKPFAFALLFVIIWTFPVCASTILQTGDVSIVGYHVDNGSMAMATWVDLEADTVIGFTDYGYRGGGDGSGIGTDGGAWRHGEGLISWTPNVSVAAGTVIVFTFETSSTSASVGTVTGGKLGLTTSGDQIFAFQGSFNTIDSFSSNLSGTLVYGLDFNGGWLTSGGINSNKSFLPGVLASANLAFSVETDHGDYAGIRTGLTDFDAYRALVDNQDQWSLQDKPGNLPTGSELNGTSFTIPEPSTLVGMIGGLCMIGCRTCRTE